MGLKEIIPQIGKNLKEAFSSIINPIEMRQLSKEVGFKQRRTSRLEGDEFVQSMITESVNGEDNTLRSLVDTLIEIKPNAEMSTQAFWKRFTTEAPLNLLLGVFNKTLDIVMNTCNRIFSNDQVPSLLSSFSEVYLEDSTESLLNPQLKDEFKGSSGGSGNGKGDASFKIDMIYEYTKKKMVFFKLTDRREPDSVLGRKILDLIKKGDLVIRDLGYSSLDIFEKIQELGAFFLSRLHGSIQVYLNPSDQFPISLGKYLDKEAKKTGGVVDVMVYLGQRFFKCRMVAYQVPKEIEKERREEYLKECKKRKRKASQEYLKRLRFTIFITNVPLNIWSAEIIGTIYRIRWQIELIFKCWKSDLRFDYLKGIKAIRIRCLIYARMIAILMMFTVYVAMEHVSLQVFERETSMHKVITWIKNKPRFMEIVLNGFKKTMWDTCIKCKRLMWKDKRRRPTTRDLIWKQTPFGSAT